MHCVQKTLKKLKLKKQNAFLSHCHRWWYFNWAGGGRPSLAMPTSLTGINIGYYLSPDKSQHYLKPNCLKISLFKKENNLD